MKSTGASSFAKPPVFIISAMIKRTLSMTLYFELVGRLYVVVVQNHKGEHNSNEKAFATATFRSTHMSSQVENVVLMRVRTEVMKNLFLLFQIEEIGLLKKRAIFSI